MVLSSPAVAAWLAALCGGANAFQGAPVSSSLSGGQRILSRDVTLNGEPMTRVEYEAKMKLDWLREALPDVTLSAENLPARPPPELPPLTTLTGDKLTIAEAEKRLAGERVVLTFECFEVLEKCTVKFGKDRSCTFGEGLVGSGEWRCVNGDPNDDERAEDVYIEFSQTLDEIRSAILGVPGKAVFWRGRVVDDSATSVRVLDGCAISEAQNPLTKRPLAINVERLENLASWVMSGTRFQREGNFTAALIVPETDLEDLPTPVVLEFKSAESSANFKKPETRKGKIDTGAQLAARKGFSS